MDDVERFNEAARLLPFALRERAWALPVPDKRCVEELRLRAGQRMTALMPEGEVNLGGEAVTARDLELLVEIATGASVHSAREMLRRGFIACRGGCRVGLCGSAILSGGEVTGFRGLSSAAIRIGRERQGIADGLLPGLFRAGAFRSTLILSPPGGGKTTLLREIVRRVSSPGPLGPGNRVGLCDERGEIAALREGRPELAVGVKTDVLDACPKAAAVMMLLRTMNPQVIALDEITAPEDTAAIGYARNCGVELIATAHALDPEDLKRRPLYRDMLADGIFENLVIIRTAGGRREYELVGGEVR